MIIIKYYKIKRTKGYVIKHGDELVIYESYKPETKVFKQKKAAEKQLANLIKETTNYKKTMNDFYNEDKTRLAHKEMADEQQKILDILTKCTVEEVD